MSAALRFRIYASTLHLGGSALVAAFAALVVCHWFPRPFWSLSGGASLFFLLIAVDAVLGPVLTAIVASNSKPRGELVRDLSVILLIQSAALGYGMHSLALARPVAVVFEVDLFRVITAADIDPASLNQAPESLRKLPWSGPRLIAVVKPNNAVEHLRSIELGLAGIPLAALPQYWRDYDEMRDAAWRAARPVADLVGRYPHSTSALVELASKTSQAVDALRFLPIVSRRSSWVAVIAASDARIVGYLALDGFF